MRTTPSLRAASVLMAAGLASTAQAVTCYSGVNVFTARGTGEVPPNGLGLSGVHIKAILAAVPDSNATVVEYPASTANYSVPYGVASANSEIAEYLDACPDSKIVIMGYSQGANVMGYVLEGADFKFTPDGTAQNYTVPPLPEKYADQVAAIVFFGDPQFNINIGINSDQPYPCNVSSRNPRDPAVFGKFADRLEEWCNYSDFACCGTGTTFDGHISYFSNENGTITGDFVANRLADLSAGSSSSSSASSAAPLTTPAAPTVYVTRSTSFVHPLTASSVVPASLSKPTRASSVSRPYNGSYSSTARVSGSGTRVSSGYGLPTSTGPSTPTVTVTPAKGAAATLGVPASIVLGWLAIARFLL